MAEVNMHTLYRFWGHNNELLYVGISSDIGRRIHQHAKGKAWFEDVDHITTGHFPDRETVLAAEQYAIKTEKPHWNVVHNTRPASQPTPAQRPTSAARPKLLPEGVVVALALSRGRYRTPVGIVTDSTPDSATLNLYSWLVGLFTAGQTTIRVPDILAMRFADTFTADQAAMLGYEPVDGIFNMDPLAEFQIEWQQILDPERGCQNGHRDSIAIGHPLVRTEAVEGNPGARFLLSGARGCPIENTIGHPGFRRFTSANAPRVPDGARYFYELTYNARTRSSDLVTNPQIGHLHAPGGTR